LVNTARFAFIIGFERCMTSALAAYLVENGYCDLLVGGIKEPSVFYGHVPLARKLVAARRANDAGRPWLDASVSYIINPAALREIKASCPEAKIIVCLRDPFQRMLSAFRYYKALHALTIGDTQALLRSGTLPDGTPIPAELLNMQLPASSWVTMLWLKHFQAFHALLDWRTEQRVDEAVLAMGELAPRYLLDPPMGKHLFTAVVAAVEGMTPDNTASAAYIAGLDREIEAFARASLPQVVLRELRHQRNRGALPGLSILRNSFFSYPLATALEIFQPSQIMLASMDRLPGEAAMDERMRHFLGVEPGAAPQEGFRRVNDTARYAGMLDRRDEEAAAMVLRDALREDGERMRDLLARHPGIDLSLYRAAPV
jgi:hypothetical protein